MARKCLATLMTNQVSMESLAILGSAQHGAHSQNENLVAPRRKRGMEFREHREEQILMPLFVENSSRYDKKLRTSTTEDTELLTT